LVHNGFNVNSPEFRTVQTLDAPWKIDFENKQIAPATVNTTELMDWTLSDDELLKYYSGTANYTTRFSYAKAEGKAVFIDLGKVGVMAKVTLNGKEVGTAWMAPYRLTISDAIKDGENTLEVEVVNVWRNRLTGDKLLPEEERTTSVLIDNITPEEELISSGLIGPVSIQVVD
jgi:hypothetical protein